MPLLTTHQTKSSKRERASGFDQLTIISHRPFPVTPASARRCPGQQVLWPGRGVAGRCCWPVLLTAVRWRAAKADGPPG